MAPLTPTLFPRQGGEAELGPEGALPEFLLYPLSPIGGEGQGEGQLNHFPLLSLAVFPWRPEWQRRFACPGRSGKGGGDEKIDRFLASVA
jgi:hypothetical protein